MSPGLTAWPPGMFSVAGTTAVIVTGRPELGDRVHRLQHRGAAGHVELHLAHLRPGLERDPAGVEGHGLAHEAQVRALRAAGVAQHDQPRLGVGALRDGGEGAHAAGGDGLAVQHLQLQVVVLLGDLLGARSARKTGSATLDGQVLQVARGVLGGRHDAGALDLALVHVLARHLQRLDRRPARRRRRLDLKRSKRVELEQRALDHGAGHAVGRGPGQETGAELAWPGRPPPRRPRGPSRRRARRACPCPPRAPALAAAGRVLVGHGHLPQPGLGLAQLHQGLQLLLGQRLALEQGDHSGVGGGLGWGAGAGGDGRLASRGSLGRRRQDRVGQPRGRRPARR